MPKRAVLIALAGSAALAASVAAGGRTAGAGELLTNGGFEEWSGGRPTGWTTTPGAATTQVANSVSGAAVRLDWPSGMARISQTSPGVEGGTYTGQGYVAADTQVVATLRITFLNAGFSSLGSELQTRTLGSGYELLSASAPAPPGTAFVILAVDLTPASGAGAAFVDSASLQESAPVPAPTPVPPTPTPQATATAAAATATVTSAATAIATGTSPAAATAAATTSATSTATATRTASPTRTPPATRTPTPPKPPTPTRTATPLPTATGTATPRPVRAAFGGLLVNGDFEDLDGDRPAGWSKFGGTMGVSSTAYRGARAAALESETSSTKWLYQIVAVQPGRWYSASAFVRVEGSGEGLIRLSWYAAPDGSGTALAQHDSEASASGEWTILDTGSVQAPENARSVRVRLMVRPAGAVTVLFDDALFVESAPPETTPAGTAAPTPRLTAAPGSDGAPGSNGGNGAAETPGSTVEQTVEAQTGLRISEVLSDPAETGRDAPYEWVELVNISGAPIELEGWALGDGKEADRLPSLLVAPGAYVVVAGKAAILPAGVQVVRIPDGEIGAGLNNSGETLRLLTPDGAEADAISFGDDDSVFDPPPPAPGPGKTLGVRNPASDPAAGNWGLTERPTPGEPNIFPAGRAASPSGVLTPGAGRANRERVPPVIEDRGKPRSPVPWIALGVSAGLGVVGLASGWQRVRKNRNS